MERHRIEWVFQYVQISGRDMDFVSLTLGNRGEMEEEIGLQGRALRLG